MKRWWLLLALVGCDAGTGDDPAPADSDPPETDAALPLGLPLTAPGDTVAGAAVVDLTPAVTEVFHDDDGDGTFLGCTDDPEGSRPGCVEGFDDADGDGVFDAVFIGGFGPMRPATGVHDPITARAVVLADGGAYLAVVSLDLVGLAHPRIQAAAELLAADGFDPDRLIVTSTHNHQGPDTMGLWGNPYPCLFGGSDCRPGFDEAYQERVAEAIAQAVREAAAAVEPVTLRVGAVSMRDLSPYYNGANFGGHNPTARMHGLVHDVRDPVVVSDQVLAIQARGEGGAVFTWTSWSGHPEVRGSRNNLLSSDWPGVAREVLEARYGGVALHTPESLGGMQSALGGDVPLVDEDGADVWRACTADDVDAGAHPCTTEGDPQRFDDGLPVPVWAEHGSWDFVHSHGHHIARAAIHALDGGVDASAHPLRSEVEDGWVPVRNVAYNLLGPMGIFDMGLDQGTDDPDLCPQVNDRGVELGCLPIRVWRLQIGPVGIATAPGELFPELAWGLPEDDPQWVREAADPTARGPGARYFVQHDPDCDDVPFEDCAERTSVGDCDCLRLHAWPYALSTAGRGPVLDDLDTGFRAAMSMTGTYLSYVVPAPDVNRKVSLLSPNDGDHYEDTVTIAHDFAEIYLETWARLNARW